MAKRSISAQIEEIARILEERRDHVKHLRGSDLSRAEEHLLRLESAFATLQWVRDHADVIRRLVQADKSAQQKRSLPQGGPEAEPDDGPDEAKTS